MLHSWQIGALERVAWSVVNETRISVIRVRFDDRAKAKHRTGKRINIMTNLTRWNPFKEMEDLQKRLNSLFSPEPARVSNGKEQMPVAHWAPLVDITEDEQEYSIQAELPDVQKSDVKVVVENGVLTISGERKSEKEEKSRKYHRVEREYGTFARSFSLPDDADEAKVTAEFKDGLLKVRLAKSEKARPRSIDVKFA